MPRKRKIGANKSGKNACKKSKPISPESPSLDEDHLKQIEQCSTLSESDNGSGIDFPPDKPFERIARMYGSTGITLTMLHNRPEPDKNPVENDKLKIVSISMKIKKYASDPERDSKINDYVKKFCSKQIKAGTEKFRWIITNDDAPKLLDLEYKLAIYMEFDQMNRMLCCHMPLRLSKGAKFFSFYGYFEETEQGPKFFLDVYVTKNIIIDDYDLFKQRFYTRNETNLEFMRFLFNHPFYETFPRTGFESDHFNDFYESVIEKQIDFLSKSKCEPPLKIDDSKLKITLWDHQRDAIKWMLNRESGNYQNDVSQLFVKHTFENIVVYYNTTFGHFVTEDVYQKFLKESNKQTKGGILADEMGLGKTVDVLALILNNRKLDTSLNAPVFTWETLFSFSTNPLQGDLQCCCGKKTKTVTETITIDELKRSCLEKNHHLNENLIKCLMCANYQHVECSNYNFDSLIVYLCFRCWTKVEPIQAPSTLVVCPNSILQQWEEEMEKQINPDLGIKIFYYRGVKSKQYCSPLDLASYDIVITTYEILRTEIDYKTAYSYERLRNSKRYYSPISPLSSVFWWRLCFDEAQLAEGNMTKVFEMAQSFPSSRHWVITGTPLQRSVDDVYSLLSFIQETPYSESFIWKYALLIPYRNGRKEYLLDVLSKCFWRRSKERIMEEIRIPKPIEEVNMLHFSLIERDYYLTKAVSYLGYIYNILCNTAGIHGDLKVCKMNNSNQSLLCHKAMQLRQICCHPQKYSDRYKIKQFNSWQDVLDRMIEESRTECKGNHRSAISSMNGLAGHYLLKGNFKKTINVYKKALKKISEYENICADITQKYHIFYNLAEIFETIGCEQVDAENNPFPPFNGTQIFPVEPPFNTNYIPSFSEDDKYFRLKAKEIYDAHVNAAKSICVTSDKYRLNLIEQCSDLKKKLRTEYWCIYVLKVLPSLSGSNDIIARIHNILPSSDASYSMPDTLDLITHQLTIYLDSFEKIHEELLSAFEPLTIENLMESTFECVDCHVRREFESSPEQCCLCEAKIKMNQFEELIFDVTHNIFDRFSYKYSIGVSNNWDEQTNLLALRKLGNWFKVKAAKNEENMSIMNDIDTFFEYIEARKKEYNAHRKYHDDCYEFVLSMDEIYQAQLRYNGLTMERRDFSQDVWAKKMYFEKLNGTLDRFKYLSNLKESLQNKESRLCSVCWSDLTRYVILECGHLLCEECCINIKRHTEPRERKCPVCRSIFFFECMNLIDVQGNQEVKGNCSTKMVEIIRCVRKILECGEKVLIYSTWPEMLTLTSEIFKQNNIKSTVIDSSDKYFNMKIFDFKSDPDISVLLLPTNFGGNRLNLVEASHVIFINSIPNKSEELQAIGRVYRIGQTRQTFVHKFIIKDTIEEMLEKNKKEMGVLKGNREMTELTIEEFCKLFNIYDHLSHHRP